MSEVISQIVTGTIGGIVGSTLTLLGTRLNTYLDRKQKESEIYNALEAELRENAEIIFNNMTSHTAFGSRIQIKTSAFEEFKRVGKIRAFPYIYDEIIKVYTAIARYDKSDSITNISQSGDTVNAIGKAVKSLEGLHKKKRRGTPGK